MSKMKGAIVVNSDRCKGCQLCIVACPKDVIDIAQKKLIATDTHMLNQHTLICV